MDLLPDGQVFELPVITDGMWVAAERCVGTGNRSSSTAGVTSQNCKNPQKLAISQLSYKYFM